MMKYTPHLKSLKTQRPSFSMHEKTSTVPFFIIWPPSSTGLSTSGRSHFPQGGNSNPSEGGVRSHPFAIAAIQGQIWCHPKSCNHLKIVWGRSSIHVWVALFLDLHGA
jgi:hypothetical protein